MKLFYLNIITLFTSYLFCQNNLNGVWQGVLLKEGEKQTQSALFYVQFEIQNGLLSGKTREEVYLTDFYAIQKIKGKINKNTIDFKQIVISSKKNNPQKPWCSSEFKGEYIDSLGYIKGTYKSSTCRNNIGTFILYRSKIKFEESTLPALGHAWRDQFLDDLKNNRKAPEIREKERADFKFQPIYFETDKTDIKVEYHSYLIEMIKVVNGHSDLRIKITGHTDADGSELYNQDLSRRRAEALKLFFKSNGLELHKLEIDFKGESEPIDNNTSEEGKKHNRRVDFKFI